MWRIALSAAAIIADVSVVLLMVIGLSVASAGAGAPVHTATSAAPLEPGWSEATLVGCGIVIGCGVLNVLAVIFGARPRWASPRLPSSAIVETFS